MKTNTKFYPSALVLEATLDSFDYPIWISDDSGSPQFLNRYAQNIVDKIRTLSQSNESMSTILFDGISFSWITRPLNHGTNYFIHELKEIEKFKQVDEIVSKLQLASIRLEKAIENTR